MATDLAAQSTLAKDTAFIGRVESAIVAEAFTIINEPTSTAGHDQRVEAAKTVLGNPSVYASLMAVGVATDAQVSADAASPSNQANVTDDHITSAVSGMWNAYFVNA